MTDENLTDDDLELVARHGNGKFERALALVKLAKRQDRVEELRDYVNGDGGDSG